LTRQGQRLILVAAGVISTVPLRERDSVSDQWDFYFANVNEKLASLFVDFGIREMAPHAGNPWLLWVWVYFHHPRDDGLSSSQEVDTLSQIEDSLTDALGSAIDAFLAGRITTDGRREFYFYAPAFVGFDDAVARGMERFPDYKWDADSHHDPEWNQYLGVLYPTRRDWQRIKNRHVIEQLQKHGDRLEKKRTVFHWAYFSHEASRGQFVAGVKERGYTVTNESDVDDPNCRHPFGVSFERVDSVDWDSMNQVTLELLELADSLAGDYDGWETSVEKEA
jgi:regulator of RNase E activity RraB